MTICKLFYKERSALAFAWLNKKKAVCTWHWAGCHADSWSGHVRLRRILLSSSSLKSHTFQFCVHHTPSTSDCEMSLMPNASHREEGANSHINWRTKYRQILFENFSTPKLPRWILGAVSIERRVQRLEPTVTSMCLSLECTRICMRWFRVLALIIGKESQHCLNWLRISLIWVYLKAADQYIVS